MNFSKFSNCDFKLLNSKLKNKKLRFDIGTSISAPVTRQWFSNVKNIFVIGIEPNPYCLDGINEWDGKTWNILDVFKENEQKENYYHIIGACDNVDTLRESKFYLLSGNVGCSSLLTPKLQNIPECEIDCEIDVETFSLKMLLDSLVYEHIELIKIDAQGKDLDITKSLGPHLRRVQFLDMEDDCRYQYENASSREEILDFMKTQNFTFYQTFDGNLRFQNNIILNKDFSNFTGGM
jgi:hypothetical protein